MKNGRFVQLLTAGKYRFMKKLGYEVQVVPMTGLVKTCGIPEDILMGDQEFAARVVKVEVPDTCLAIRFVNQAFKEVLTGPEALFWNVFEKNTFQMVDMTEPCMEKVLPRMYICLLYTSTLDDGSGTDRTILSGIHEYYEPEELIGKTAIAIVNLPPRKMMGIDSCGMLISAVHEEDGREGLNLLMVDDRIPAGAKLY